MTNYNNGKIYKIEPINGGEDGDVYIGSTTKEFLCQRMATHRSNYKQYLKGNRRNVTSFKLFEKYGVESCQIILLESVHANTRDELHAREAHFIKTIACVNKCIPLQTIKEYNQIHKDEIQVYQKEYKQIHKNELIEKAKVHYQANKAKINQKKKEKINCECGSICRIGDKSQHIKTIKHQDYLNSLN